MALRMEASFPYQDDTTAVGPHTSFQARDNAVHVGRERPPTPPVLEASNQPHAAAPGNPSQVLWTRIIHTLAADGIEGVLLSEPGILGARGSNLEGRFLCLDHGR